MMPPPEARCVLPRRLLLGSSVNKGQERGPRLLETPALESDMYYSFHTAVVETFLQVPGVPSLVHTNSAPLESMYISPLV